MLLAIRYKKTILTHEYNNRYSVLAFFCIISYIGLLYVLGFKSINYYGNTLGIVPITAAISLCGIYIILYISRIISEAFSEKALTPLLWVGRNSIIFLVIHQTCIIHPMNMYNLLLGYPIVSGIIRFILIFIICAFGVRVINSYFKKSIY